MKKLLIRLGLVLLWLPSCYAFAGPPTETVETQVKKVLVVLGDSSYEGEAGRETKTKQIRLIAGELFDFEELSKRALGRNWKKFKPEDRDEFVQLYRTLLENVYIARLLVYKNEVVEFYKEQEISETKAEVFSHIVRESSKIPMNYRMIKKGGAWRVYDVIIEGVSMTKNYRSQFKSMLRKKPPEDLLKVLRAKTAGKS